MVQWLALFSPSKKVVGLNRLLATDILNIKPYFNTLPLAFAKCKHIFLHVEKIIFFFASRQMYLF